MRLTIIVMHLLLLLACSKVGTNTFEGAIPYYRNGASNLRLDALDGEDGVRNSIFTFASNICKPPINYPLPFILL